MTPLGLTARQSDLLAFIAAEIEAGRPAPSYDEMARHLGISGKSCIHRLLNALEERGHIVRMTHRARSVALTADSSATPRSTGLTIAPPVAERLNAYCARRRRDARDVIADALSDYWARHP